MQVGTWAAAHLVCRQAQNPLGCGIRRQDHAPAIQIEDTRIHGAEQVGVLLFRFAASLLGKLEVRNVETDAGDTDSLTGGAAVYLGLAYDPVDAAIWPHHAEFLCAMGLLTQETVAIHAHTFTVVRMHQGEPLRIRERRVARRQPMEAEELIRADYGSFRHMPIPDADAGGILGQPEPFHGFAWAAAMGHTVRPTYPALVPLTGDAPAHHALAGVALAARVTARSSGERAASTGGFLFTHKGWSGPAVLDVSHVVERAALGGASAEV